MKVIQEKPISLSFCCALIISRFNEEITNGLAKGALARLREIGIADEKITVVWVPGAIEIPLVAQRLARTQNYEAIIALGAVIRGETSHYDYVCKQVSDGCQRVSLEHNVPVIFGVLTTEDEKQALARVGGEHGHKGRDAVNAAIETISILRQI